VNEYELKVSIILPIMNKKLLLSLIALFAVQLSLVSQTPTYFYHNPINAGTNNIFFHTINGRMVFIFTQAELASTGIPPGYTIGSIWFRNSSNATTTLTNFQIHLGYSTNTVPDPIFWDNFNVNGRTRVLNEASYTYNSVRSTNVSNSWTEIPLTTPFVYNGSNNLAIQIRFANSSNIGISFFADNGGTPITQYHNNRGATTANRTASRPMLGFSEGSILNNAALTFQVDRLERGGIKLSAAFEEAEAIEALHLSQLNAQSGTFEWLASGKGSKMNWETAWIGEGEQIFRMQAFDPSGNLLAQQVRSVYAASKSQFVLYPTVATRRQDVEIRSPQNGELFIEIYDLQGLLVRKEKKWVEDKRTSVGIHDLTTGIYKVKLSMGTEQAFLSLMVK